MRGKDKVIITAALAGGQSMKEHNPSVPCTPEEFLREGRRAEEAGAEREYRSDHQHQYRHKS